MKTWQDLKNKKDKMAIFQDFPVLRQYVRTTNELIDAMVLCLDDNQKLEIMEYECFKNLTQFLKAKVVMTITSNEVQSQILQNTTLLGEIFHPHDFVKFMQIVDDQSKMYVLNNPEILKKFDVSKHDIKKIIESMSNENKKIIILEENHGLSNSFIQEIIGSLEVEDLIDFINNNKTFLQEKNIKPYKIVEGMPTEKQLKLAERISGTHITGQIIPKLDEDLSQYKDFGELLSINGRTMVKSDKDRQRLLELCEICPNINIQSNFKIGISTGKEYIEGEKWISSVLQGIQPQWSDVQKIAYIDTAIGKRISYTPDFDTEVENGEDARALWKIITSGYGVCNGIAQIEQYLLQRIGIEAELVSSKNHTFVKVKNIEIPTENGFVQGDTLVDPTWNLTASRYGSKPQHFCKSYEELRKVDIGEDGIDNEAHRNYILEHSTTINMDDDSLRRVYKSIGITDKRGRFPIGKLKEQIAQIDESDNDMQTKMIMKFSVLKQWCPEFATCQNSTIEVLKTVVFENSEFRRCIASRVYDRADSKKQAVLYVYMDTEENGKQFFYADKEAGEFINLSQEEFEAKFECYEADMKKVPGNKRPWETDEEMQSKKEGR